MVLLVEDRDDQIALIRSQTDKALRAVHDCAEAITYLHKFPFPNFIHFGSGVPKQP